MDAVIAASGKTLLMLRRTGPPYTENLSRPAGRTAPPDRPWTETADRRRVRVRLTCGRHDAFEQHAAAEVGENALLAGVTAAEKRTPADPPRTPVGTAASGAAARPPRALRRSR
ncbi:hypothetical protein AB0D78_21755 [Streptomyces avermitilis]|uniref:hypothetical protein n=1 Tax=Streptomyces avermitilis TaxID=33903 RepID=UPI0033F209D5